MAETITTDQDHRQAIAEVEALIGMAPALGTPESDRLLALAAAVEEYEDRTFWPK